MSARGRTGLAAAVLAVAVAMLAIGASVASAASGEISGTVTEFGTATPIKGVEACAYSEAAEEEECAITAADGSYTISGLEPGEFLLEFWAPGLGYQIQYYADKANESEAETLQVTSGGHLTGKDGHLHKAAGISGRVTAAQNGAPVKESIVCARLYPSGAYANAPCVLTAADGTYTLNGLSSGSYIVAFSEELTPSYNDGFAVQYFDRKATLAEATPVSVTAPEAKTGIDGLLLHPGEAFAAPPAPVVTAPVAPAAPKRIVDCKKGFKRKKVAGKTRCVKLKKKHHKHRHSHRH